MKRFASTIGLAVFTTALACGGQAALAQFDDPTFTRFLGHYDGNTGSAGRDADYSAGNPVPVVLRGQTEAAQAKFGPQSLNPVFANNPGQRLRYETAGVFNNPAGDTFALNAGTVEMWVYRYQGQNVFNSLGFFGTWAGNSDLRIQVGGSGNLEASMFQMPGFTNGWGITSAADVPGGIGDVIPQGQWSHIAWTWDFAANGGNGVSTLWVNGQDVSGAPTFVGTYDQISDFNLPADPTFQIGSIQNGSFPLPATPPAAMYIDEFRISNTARYTANFTPQDTPFSIPEPSSAAVILVAGASLVMRRFNTK